MFNCNQFRSLIVRPTLEHIGLYSKEAEDLLIGTAAVESRLGTYLAQLKGPAKGVFQMEPETHDYIWESFLRKPSKKILADNVLNLLLTVPLVEAAPESDELVYNLVYATAMSRVFYLRFREPIPVRFTFPSKAQYIQALGAYWKEYYNTYKGKGTVEYFTKAWHDCGCDE